MVSGAGLKAVGAAGALMAAAVGGAIIARADDPGSRAAQTAGGLALSTVGAPAGATLLVDQPAQAGSTRTFRVANNSATELAVTAKARPWTQSATGAVAANRRGTLAGVGVSEEAFTLAPGASKDVTVTLRSVPSSGYLYGAFEVVGVPSDLARRRKVVTGYRLLSSLRYNAATARYGLRGGAARVSGKGASRAATLTVRNTGNTIAPVTGTVRLKSALGTRNSSIRSARILPGRSIEVTLGSGTSLRAGSYTATVTLIQSRRKTTITKRFRVR